MKCKTLFLAAFILLVSNLYSQNNRSIAKDDFSPHLEMDLIKKDESNYIKALVSIRQKDKEGTVFLIAAAVVYFNSSNKVHKTNLSSKCKDTKIKKDQFISIEGNFKECVVDCLKNNKVLMASYYLEKEKLLESLRKK